jgi:hypothetical protein
MGKYTKSIPKGRDVSSFVARIRLRTPMAGSGAAPRHPSPPALLTAAVSSGVTYSAEKPACTIG